MAKEYLSGILIWLALRKAGRAVQARAEESLRPLELGASDFAVLEVLRQKGPLPVNAIGEEVELTSGSMSTAVDRLEAKGLVQRSTWPQDRRVRLVQLTPAGRDLVREAYARQQAAMERAAAALSPEERAALIRLLRKLRRGAAAPQVQGPEPGDEPRGR